MDTGATILLVLFDAIGVTVVVVVVDVVRVPLIKFEVFEEEVVGENATLGCSVKFVVVVPVVVVNKLEFTQVV